MRDHNLVSILSMEVAQAGGDPRTDPQHICNLQVVGFILIVGFILRLGYAGDLLEILSQVARADLIQNEDQMGCWTHLKILPAIISTNNTFSLIFIF